MSVSTDEGVYELADELFRCIWTTVDLLPREIQDEHYPQVFRLWYEKRFWKTNPPPKMRFVL